MSAVVARILIVDLDDHARTLISDFCRTAGHAVVVTADAAAATRVAYERRPEIAIVDLPFATQAERDLLSALCHDVRVRTLVAVASEHDAAQLPAGVEAIVKPYALSALGERVDGMSRAMTPIAPTAFTTGALRVDRETREVTVGGEEVRLTVLELELLLFLYDRRDSVQSRDALLHHVWGMQGDVTTRTVDTHVKRLRQKLGAAAEHVQTVRFYGYRFVAPE